MGFRKRPETDLERELRAERPSPRKEFMQMLGSQLGGDEKSRHSRGTGRTVPRIALVGAATLVLAASLGVAGALGHAGSSVKSFGTSVYHIVNAPGPVTQNSLNHQNYKKDGPGDPNDDNDHDGRLPFHHEYHHFVPICHNLVITFVPVQAFIRLILFGQGHWTVPFFGPLRCVR